MPKSGPGRRYLERKRAELRGFECGPDDVDESAGVRTDGIEDAWTEAGSDELMDFDVLVRIRAEATLAEVRRARRIARRGE